MWIYKNCAYVASGNQGDYAQFPLNILSFVTSPVDNSRIYRRGEVVPIIRTADGDGFTASKMLLMKRSILLIGKVTLSVLPAGSILLIGQCQPRALC